MIKNRIISKTILLAFSVLLFLFLLKAVDLYLIATDKNLTKMAAESPLANALDPYPYTEFHVQSNFRTKGNGNGTCYNGNDVDVISGKHGFFIFDFDIDQPPVKRDNEIRIILIGGSGAQGWGARTNDDMFYNLLQNRLQNIYKDRGFNIRVINLAMGSSVTYQNFIALNRWGHILEPDLILSFSGRNDIYVPVGHTLGTNVPFGYNDFLRVASASQPWNNPYWLKQVGHFFPGLVARFGICLRMLLANDNYFLEYKNRFPANYDISGAYIHALASIKRDFLGMPIALVAQPYIPQFQLNPPFDFSVFMDSIFSKINGYLNNEWYFLNLNKKWSNEAIVGASGEMQQYLQDDCHLNNLGHQRATNDLTHFLLPIIDNIILKRKQEILQNSK